MGAIHELLWFMTPEQLQRLDQQNLVTSMGGTSTCRPCCRSDAGSDQTPDVEELGCSLPPMPTPDRAAMRSEATGGISLVLCLVATFVTLTIVFSSSATNPNVYIGMVALICTEAAVALTCLYMLMMGDPGVIRRTRASCMPVPPEVVEKLQSGFDGDQPHPLAGMGNISDAERTYCVRCCIWRDDTSKPRLLARCAHPPVGRVHHCSTCQRCVRQFE